MKIAAIDIGSNSVRLMVRSGGKTLYKKLCTTRLGEGLALTGSLKAEAIERTAQAVATFVREGEDAGAQVYAFATAAVRSSRNGGALVDRVKALTGLTVDVISGEQEAEIGLKGAVGTRTGGIIDIGGASTEVSLQESGVLRYAKSVSVGTVRLFDLCGQDREKLEEVIAARLSEYGAVPDIRPIYGVGGTATTLAAVWLALPQYDPERVNGCRISLPSLKALSERILAASVEERRQMPGMDVSKADVIGGGSLLLVRLMERLGLEEITVSESDNLEGYVIVKGLS